MLPSYPANLEHEQTLTGNFGIFRTFWTKLLYQWLRYRGCFERYVWEDMPYKTHAELWIRSMLAGWSITTWQTPAPAAAVAILAADLIRHLEFDSTALWWPTSRGLGAILVKWRRSPSYLAYVLVHEQANNRFDGSWVNWWRLRSFPSLNPLSQVPQVNRAGAWDFRRCSLDKLAKKDSGRFVIHTWA